MMFCTVLNVFVCVCVRLQASLIMHIADAGPEGGISLDRLAAVSEAEAAEVRRKMGFWIAKGVVSASTSSSSEDGGGGGNLLYTVIEDQAGNAAREAEGDMSMASAGNFEEEVGARRIE